MSKVALFIRHRALPGMRDEIHRVWAKHVQPRAAVNAAHEAYFFCYDREDADLVCVFQLYSNAAAMQDFLRGAWYAGYLREIDQYIAASPQITPADLVWEKASRPVSLTPVSTTEFEVR